MGVGNITMDIERHSERPGSYGSLAFFYAGAWGSPIHNSLTVAAMSITH